MADSASDPEVDDVLLSVRRLVSQEIPKRAMTEAASDPGALVLSSKDRIEAEHSKRAATRSLEQRIAELEAAVDQSTSEFEPDGSEDPSLHRPDRIVYTRPRSSETATDPGRGTLRLSEIALLETVPEPEPDAGPIGGRAEAPVEFRRGTSKPVAEAPMAEDVPSLPPTTAEVRAFSDPDDVVARIEARIERGGELDEPTPPPASEPETARVDEVDDAVVAALEPAKDTTPAVPSDDRAAKPPVTETPVPEAEASQPAKAEPVPAPAIDIAQAAILTARAQSLSTVETATQPGPKTGQDAGTTALERADAALATLADEDAMRLLVGRLLRDELQGELGERITQNVRKLVRSEVKRMILSRELD
ncbi:MAG: hypothetical protein AAF222_05970 [Pseudomonadota bacterium]